MQKTFNREKVMSFVHLINDTYRFKGVITEQDVYTKKAFGKIKSFVNDPTGRALAAVYINLVMNSTNEKIEEMIKRFFPTKFDSVRQFVESGGNYKTTSFMWHPIDGKIHWTLLQFHGDEPGDDAESREMKLKTDLYLDRTVEERKMLLDQISSSLERLYGYHIGFASTGNWFITDGNKDVDGYKKLVEGVGDKILYIRKNNKFCNVNFTTKELIYA